MKQMRGTLLAGVLTLAIASMATEARSEEAGEAQPPEGAPAQDETQSLDQLVAELSRPDSSARVVAVRALGERRDGAAVPHLVNLLRADPVPEVRGWAVRALHDIGTPESRSAVVTAAREDPDERVRTMAAQLGGVSVPPPQPFANTPAPQVQPVTPYAEPTYPMAGQIQPIQRPPRVRGRGLRIGGLVTTSVSYGLALIVGISLLAAGDETEPDPWDGSVGTRNYVDWGWKLLLPIVGPAVGATTNDLGEASIPFWIWTAAQIAGVALLAVGYVQRARHLREQEGVDDEDIGEGAELDDDETYEDEEDDYDDDTYEDEARSRRFGVAFVPSVGGFSLSGWF